MASYHRNTGASGGSGYVPRRSKPTPVRSSAGTSSSAYGGGGRPRSFGLFSPHSSGGGGSYGGYGGLGLTSSVGSYGSGSLYGGSNGLGSSGSTYGGTSSGYGGMTFHSPTSYSSINLSSSPKSRSASPANSYYSSYLSPSSASYGSGRNVPVKSNSFNRTLNSRRSPLSSMGPRSGSLSSLAVSTRSGDSEGYSSGGDYSGRSSRHNSVSSTGGGGDAAAARSAKGAAAAASENGELDYKKLYEEASADNDRLRETLKKTDKELADTKSHLIKASAEPSKSSLSEIEKRERRAMERKLSEMEEELKLLDQIRSENQRLKDENGALIRVISKLSK